MTTAISLRSVSEMSAGFPEYFVPSTYTAIVVAGAQYWPMHVPLIATFHSVKNWPSRLGVLLPDSVWMTPESSCVCRGEMQGCAQPVIPPYAGSPFHCPC